MKTLTHKYLAEHIAEQYLRGFSPMEKRAYIYGSIAPDVNKITYLHGWVDTRSSLVTIMRIYKERWII